MIDIKASAASGVSLPTGLAAVDIAEPAVAKILDGGIVMYGA